MDTSANPSLVSDTKRSTPGEVIKRHETRRRGVYAGAARGAFNAEHATPAQTPHPPHTRFLIRSRARVRRGGDDGGGKGEGGGDG